MLIEDVIITFIILGLCFIVVQLFIAMKDMVSEFGFRGAIMGILLVITLPVGIFLVLNNLFSELNKHNVIITFMIFGLCFIVVLLFIAMKDMVSEFGFKAAIMGMLIVITLVTGLFLVLNNLFSELNQYSEVSQSSEGE